MEPESGKEFRVGECVWREDVAMCGGKRVEVVYLTDYFALGDYLCSYSGVCAKVAGLSNALQRLEQLNK
jgi:hypothetical protein